MAVNIKPKFAALETMTVRPGDKLVIRMGRAFSRQDAEEFKARLAEKLPGVEAVLIHAEQILVYREAVDE